MQAFLINLARRPDRLAIMARQLKQLRIPYRRIRAVDARTTPDAVIDRRFAADGPLGEIAKGDKCCTLSHMRAWEAFLATKERFGLVLEDDVLLDHRAARLLRSEAWIPADAGLIKLEQYVSGSRRILVGEPIGVDDSRTIAPLMSKHTGAAAYIIARETAGLLLHGVGKWTLPVDHMLFNPSNSPLANRLRPYQMMPPVARQSQDIGGATDIEEWRVGLRKASPRALRRELLHAYYEVRLLPLQIARVLARTARIVRFDSHNAFAAPAPDAPLEALAELS